MVSLLFYLKSEDLLSHCLTNNRHRLQPLRQVVVFPMFL